MTRVLVFGSFDLIHAGHLAFLKEAKAHGDELIVVLARDSTIEDVKHHKPRFSEGERKKHMVATGLADQVVFGHHADKYRVIEELRPDVICLGYDQTFFADKLNEELAKREIAAKIVRLKPYKEEIYKSSKLKA